VHSSKDLVVSAWLTGNASIIFVSIVLFGGVGKGGNPGLKVNRDLKKNIFSALPQKIKDLLTLLFHIKQYKSSPTLCA